MTRQELIDKAIAMLDGNDDIFVQAVNELDSYNGFADGWRCEPMDYLDDYFYDVKPSELLQQLSSDFDIRDNYFYCGIYGVESTDYPEELYRNNTDSGEVFDELLDHWNSVDIYDSEFCEIMDNLYNEEYDDADEEPEEELPYGSPRNSADYTGWTDEE